RRVLFRSPDTKLWAGRSRKVMSHYLDMNVGRESDRGVLPAKCPNKGGSSSPAEGMEGRPLTKENTGQMAASQIQSWGDASAGLRRVREAAKRDKRLRSEEHTSELQSPCNLVC